ncbi:MAG: ABC transporter permease, partial [Pseudomonadota bacterium]
MTSPTPRREQNDATAPIGASKRPSGISARLLSWLTGRGGPPNIVPRESVAASSLGVLVGIMAFLASLTLGAVVMVSETANGWQNEIAREVTIQIPVSDGRNLQADAETAQQIAEATAGVTAVTRLDQKAGSALLEPWLGSDIDVTALPVPELILLRISPSSPPDFIALKTTLATAVPGAVLDTHGLWLNQLARMAETTILLGLSVFVLVMVASILTVVFATRGAMAGNQNVIEVLHFVGAE